MIEKKNDFHTLKRDCYYYHYILAPIVPPVVVIFSELFPPTDPRLWSTTHVQRWLELVSRDQGLRGLNITSFSHVDGRNLCRMRREDFLQLVGPYEADVLLASLTYLRRGENMSSSIVLCMLLHFSIGLHLFH